METHDEAGAVGATDGPTRSNVSPKAQLPGWLEKTRCEQRVVSVWPSKRDSQKYSLHSTTALSTMLRSDFLSRARPLQRVNRKQKEEITAAGTVTV